MRFRLKILILSFVNLKEIMCSLLFGSIVDIVDIFYFSILSACSLFVQGTLIGSSLISFKCYLLYGNLDFLFCNNEIYGLRFLVLIWNFNVMK